MDWQILSVSEESKPFAEVLTCKLAEHFDKMTVSSVTEFPIQIPGLDSGYQQKHTCMQIMKLVFTPYRVRKTKFTFRDQQSGLTLDSFSNSCYLDAFQVTTAKKAIPDSSCEK